VTEDKRGVQQWDGRSYEDAASHHRAHDERFLIRHPPAPDADVVDVGCGSGEFTVRLASLVEAGHVVGIEPDPSMLAQAQRHIAANLSFIEGRAQELDRLVPARSFDLVVSRAMLHWIDIAEYPRCYEAVCSVLRPGGWFHAESAGAGNVSRLIDVLDDVAGGLGLPPARVTLPTAAAAFDLLEGAGFEIGHEGVRTVAQRRSFSEQELLDFVRTQAVHAYEIGDDELRRLFVTTVQTCKEKLRRSDGSWDQTFVRLELLVRRPT
jgi:trans-aconitate methyltransferase